MAAALSLPSKPSVRKVLVIGGGISGCSAAALLARGGVEVDLVEIKDTVSALGSGITLMGNAVRVLAELGVWEQIRAAGFIYEGVKVVNAEGAVLAEAGMLPPSDDLPDGLGIYRPTLSAIVLNAATAAGATVMTGTTALSLESAPGGMLVTLSGAHPGERSYDLVIVADGVGSRTRTMLGFPDTARDVGLGIWRIHARRPVAARSAVTVHEGGPCHIAGYTPTGEATLYAYWVETLQDRSHLSHRAQLDVVRELASHYHGDFDAIRADITDDTPVNYSWFPELLVQPRWHRDAALLIGDAAHACPPTLAQGAAMGLEDASVLAQLIHAGQHPTNGLFDAFHQRRFERVRFVTDASLHIAGVLRDGLDPSGIPTLMDQTAALVATAP